jgi:hypothetical protein
LQTFFSFIGVQCLKARSSRIENSSRRESDLNKVVSVLPREYEVVFPAVEAPAQEGAAIIDCAAVQSQVNTAATPVCGQAEDRIAGAAMAQNLELIGFHLVPFVRMKNKPLITRATFRAAVTIRP